MPSKKSFLSNRSCWIYRKPYGGLSSSKKIHVIGLDNLKNGRLENIKHNLKITFLVFLKKIF